MVIESFRKTGVAWVGIAALSSLFMLGQDSWPEKPTLAVVTPTVGEVAVGSLSIDIQYSNAEMETLEVTLNDEEITSSLSVTQTGASGIIYPTEEQSYWINCSVSNAAGTVSATRYFHYSPTGFDPDVSSLTAAQYTQVHDQYPLMGVLHEDLVELAQDVKQYAMNPVSRLKFGDSQYFMTIMSLHAGNSESYDGMVHLVELKIPPVGSGPVYWAWIWEWLSPTSFKWYLPNSSVVFDYSDPENPVLTFDPPLNQTPYASSDHRALPLSDSFSCFAGGAAAMGWLTCFGAFGGASITCAACIASGGANLPACAGCFFTILTTVGACGSCDLCTYPWCN